MHQSNSVQTMNATSNPKRETMMQLFSMSVAGLLLFAIFTYLVDRGTIITKFTKEMNQDHRRSSEAIKYLRNNNVKQFVQMIEEDSNMINDDDNEIKFSWLMSFPNSGTSYTLKMATSISQSTMASNYGQERTDEFGNSLLFGNKYPFGPFRGHENLPIPSGYMLTKTHCGSRCTSCHPSKYVETEWSFKQKCLTGKRILTSGAGQTVTELQAYDEKFIKKAVHLIRNPFDNIVSRFHLHWKHQKAKGDDSWILSHPKNATGFQEWCKDSDKEYFEDERELYYANIPNLDDIPCHAEFFRYTQWHNRAFQVIKKMDIPSLILHYEDYDENFDETISKVASFLELKIVGDPSEYYRNNYGDYYNDKQRQFAIHMINLLSTKQTWDSLKNRYGYSVL